jgi:hypothetical protein
MQTWLNTMKTKAEQEEYETDRRAAEDEYAAALEGYNSQSAGAKVLTGVMLGDDGKPQKRHVTKRFVKKPMVRNDIPSESEIAAGLVWDGFMKTDNSNYKVMMTMPNYSVTFKDQAVSEKQYRSATISVPIDMKVTDPSGKVVFQMSFAAPQYQRTYKSDKMASPQFSEFINGSGYNSWLDQRKMDARQAVYTAMSSELNSQMGYGWVDRTDPVYTGKDKKQDYSAQESAQLKATQGLKDLSISEESAKVKLGEAMEVWISELKDENLGDKKARINNKVAAGLYINAALVNILLGDHAKADELLNIVQGNDAFKGGDQKESEAVRVFLDDERRRKDS